MDNDNTRSGSMAFLHSFVFTSSAMPSFVLIFVFVILQHECTVQCDQQCISVMYILKLF
jgi:hypothetical protein